MVFDGFFCIFTPLIEKFKKYEIAQFFRQKSL